MNEDQVVVEAEVREAMLVMEKNFEDYKEEVESMARTLESSITLLEESEARSKAYGAILRNAKSLMVSELTSNEKLISLSSLFSGVEIK